MSMRRQGHVSRSAVLIAETTKDCSSAMLAREAPVRARNPNIQYTFASTMVDELDLPRMVHSQSSGFVHCRPATLFASSMIFEAPQELFSGHIGCLAMPKRTKARACEEIQVQMCLDTKTCTKAFHRFMAHQYSRRWSFSSCRYHRQANRSRRC